MLKDGFTPRSLSDAATMDGVLHSSYREAALSGGMMNEVSLALKEAVDHNVSPSQLRHLLLSMQNGCRLRMSCKVHDGTEMVGL